MQMLCLRPLTPQRGSFELQRWRTRGINNSRLTARTMRAPRALAVFPTLIYAAARGLPRLALEFRGLRGCLSFLAFRRPGE